jgi:hypothetical protein
MAKTDRPGVRIYEKVSNNSTFVSHSKKLNVFVPSFLVLLLYFNSEEFGSKRKQAGKNYRIGEV